ncbi:hypothetical protein ACI0FM_14205 [Paenochrobactrum sp. BZR 588]|uniref:hypothetical protein n=1 Tax=Paenochrobactrum TaxID=999488 RepID=UPI0035BC24E3
MTSVRFQIAAALSVMVSAVLFGIGAVIVLSVPELSEEAKYLLPAVIILSFLITPFISWIIAPRLRNRYWQRRKIMQEK